MDSHCYDSGPIGLPHIDQSDEFVYSARPSLSPERASKTTVSLAPEPLPLLPLTLSDQECESSTLVNKPTESDNNVHRGTEPAMNHTEKERCPTSVPAVASANEWTLVQNKNKNKKRTNRLSVTKGKAILEPSSKFRAANVKVPLFINNVHKETAESDIIDYILEKTNEPVTLKKINMKFKRGYNSYKIFVPQSKLTLFLDDELWPEGISFRRFVYLKPGSDKTVDNTLKSSELSSTKP